MSFHTFMPRSLSLRNYRRAEVSLVRKVMDPEEANGVPVEDARSLTVFTFTKENFSEIQNSVLSPPCMVPYLEWKIMIQRRSNTDYPHPSLGFFLQCNGDAAYPAWSCTAIVSLIVVSQSEGIENFRRDIHDQRCFFSTQNDLGFEHFMPWNDVLNPDLGFIKNDTVIFRVEVNAKPPKTNVLDLPKCTCHIRLNDQMNIFTWNSLSQSLSKQCNMDLKLWAPLATVNQSLLAKVRLAYVFGRYGSEALIITKDDEVWACGFDNSNCFSLRKAGLQNATLDSIHRVDELNKQDVTGLSFGLNQENLEVDNDDPLTTFMVVCTSSGNVIQFGRPKGGKYDFECDSDIIPISKLWCLPKISEVACGSQHCLALSTTGQVYSWGSNKYGQLGNGNTSVNYCDVPKEIENILKNKCVVKISCGFSFSVALLDDGRIYTWGRDICEKENNKCHFLPVRVSKHRFVIREIACGFSHILALSNARELYVWGANNRGQLGLGDNVFRSVPQKIETIEEVVEIAASYLSCTSAARTATGEVFMWGDCSGSVVRKPMKIPYKSLMEVFAHYATPRVTYKPIIRQLQSNSLSDTTRITRRTLNDEETSDLVIKTEDDKKIFVHRTILRLRSEYFQIRLKNEWTKEDEKIINVNQAYDVIYSYLQYLYTEEFEADPELTQELLVLADEYQDLSFKELCEEKLQRSINVDTVGILFPLASRINAKRVRESCLLYSCSRLSEVMESPAPSSWDGATLSEFDQQCKKRKLK